MATNRLISYIYVALGSIFVILGIVGAFLPLLPTTPFLLLAAALYLKGSKRLYAWLINQRLLGSYIRNFMKHKSIPLRIKIISITMMWAAIIYCSIFIMPYLWHRIILAAVAIGATIYILSFKTLRNNNQKG